MAEWYFIVCVYHILFLYSSVDGHLFVPNNLSYFYLLAGVNDAAVNIGTQLYLSFSFKFFWVYD